MMNVPTPITARPSKQSYNAASRSHYAKMQSPDNRSRAIAGLNLTYLYSRRRTETKWERETGLPSLGDSG